MWFNLATTRGDIIGRIDGVTDMTELRTMLSSIPFVIVNHPMSPKTSPRILKMCDVCNTHDTLTEEEEKLAQAGKMPACNSCNNQKVTLAPDASTMKITYTSLGTLFDNDKLIVGTSQVAHACVIANQTELDQVQKELYDKTGNVIKLSNA